MVDYCSNYFEVAELTKKTSLSVINQFKVQFARHGSPPPYCTETAARSSQVASSVNLLKCWKIEHIPSSPRYPQSNGKSENAVKTCKTLKIQEGANRPERPTASTATLEEHSKRGYRNVTGTTTHGKTDTNTPADE